MRLWPIIAACSVLLLILLARRPTPPGPEVDLDSSPPPSRGLVEREASGGQSGRGLPSLLRDYRSGLSQQNAGTAPAEVPESAVQETPIEVPEDAPRLDRFVALLRAGDRGSAGMRELINESIQSLSPAEFNGFLRDVGRRIATEEPRLFEASLSQFAGARERTIIMNATVETLVSEGPIAASSWFDELSDPAGRSQAAEVLAREWAKSDLQGALDWVTGLEPGSSESVKGNEGLVWTWMQSDPDAVVEYANNLVDPTAKSKTFVKAAKMLSIKDPAAAAAWAADFPGESERRELIDYSLYRWARDDPNAARSWVEGIEDQGVQTGASQALVRAWADRDPAAATQWVVDNQAQMGGDLPLLNASKIWAEQDPRAASRWIEGLNDSRIQGLIVDNISRASASRGDEAASAWLDQLSDPTLKARALELWQREAGRP